MGSTIFFAAWIGSLVLASVLIVLHYVGLWRLTRRHAMNSYRVKTYRTDTGRLIWWVLILPIIFGIVLGIPYIIFNETIIYPMRLSQMRKDADTLVLAIEQFRTDAGKYPDTLNNLVPEYLERIPQLPGNAQFEYQFEGDKYSLSYAYPSIAPVFCHYTQNFGWYCD
ncbi:MAG: hypothetical protein JXA21_29850 [Anaerolineae bacterium]|nr:hypothetical protein [Anaerolineae bacterium]